MLEPLKHVLAEHKTLIVESSLNNLSIVQARLNLDLFCDVHTLLTLFYLCLLPLLEFVNSLIKFS